MTPWKRAYQRGYKQGQLDATTLMQDQAVKTAQAEVERQYRGAAERATKTIEQASGAFVFRTALGGHDDPADALPYSRYDSGTRKLLELALREALSFGHNYVGTEHVLAAIVRYSDCEAAKALDGMGVAVEDVRDAIVARLSKRTPDEARRRQREAIEQASEACVQANKDEAARANYRGAGPIVNTYSARVVCSCFVCGAADRAHDALGWVMRRSTQA